MRKRIAVAITVLAVLLTATVAWADNTFEGFQIVKVMLNGQEVESDVPAISLNGRTMLPLRKLAELAGLKIDRWDAETNTAYLSGGSGQPVATVNGQTISQQALYDRLVAQSGTQLLDRIIEETLIDQAAAKAGVTIAPQEVEKEIAAIKARLGGEAEFQQALSSNQITLEDLRFDIGYQLKLTRLVTKDFTVTDEQLRAFFEANRVQFDTTQVHARHILVDTEDQARAIKAELEKGADFTALAKEHSTDPSAQTNGGDLGAFGRGQMVPEFEKVVFGLKEGEISQPFQTAFGWHIAQVVKVEGSAPEYERMKDQVREIYLDLYAQDRIPAYLNELKAKAAIENSLK